MSEQIIGQILLNQFRVDEFIGSGSMSVVYRVWDLKRSSSLAMKILKGELADDPAMFKYFKRGAKALEKLAHPHIVPFYGLHKADNFTFALEAYIKGPSLRDIIRQQQKQALPLMETLCVMKAVCSALGYAHANGVVHCDVKPGNIMIDQGGNVFLTDFGIARHADSTTTTMGAAGTPAYMAPEQIRGEVVTAATDVYAMGIMVFEMFTGRRPFEGKDLKSSSSESGATQANLIRTAHLTQPPPDPRSHNPAISPEMSAAILKALEKEPQNRFQDIMQFFFGFCKAANITLEQIPDRLLKYVHEPEPIMHPEPTTGDGAVRKPPSKRALPFILGGAGLVIVVFGFFVFGNNPISTPEPITNPTNTNQAATPTARPVTKTPTPTRTPTKLPPSQTPTITLTPTPANRPLALQINAIDGAEIVWVPEGEFLMGSNPSTDPYFFGAEGPEHMVLLDEYWIYRSEVTNAMYQQCVAEHACPRPAWNSSNTRSDYFGNQQYANYPVVYVSWLNAAAYCRWAGGRLPTEAEWEKAGRGTDGRLFPWGENNPSNQVVHYNTTDTASVGSYPYGASPYGAFDMSGNVHEWVFDLFQATFYSVSPEENPTGPISGTTRVYRGGAYHNLADGLRVVMRGSRAEDFTSIDIGFRCVVELP